MRTIKFRGKSLSGEWLYGYLYKHGITPPSDFLCIGQAVLPWKDTVGVYVVDPETIGQFTGLYDKNGKEIYEGDIVEFYTKDTYCINPDCEPHLLGYGSCIHKETDIVEFSDCIFGVEGKHGIVPLFYCGINEIDIEELKEREEHEAYFDANGYEIGDSIIGIKVIGNVFDNLDLLK